MQSNTKLLASVQVILLSNMMSNSDNDFDILTKEMLGHKGDVGTQWDNYLAICICTEVKQASQ